MKYLEYTVNDEGAVISNVRENEKNLRFLVQRLAIVGH